MLHDVKLVIDLDVEAFEGLPAEFAMLRSRYDYWREASRLGEALNDRRKLDRFGPGADDHGHWNFFHRRASQNKERSQINEGQGRPKVFPQRAVAKGRSSRGPLRPESAGFFRH